MSVTITATAASAATGAFTRAVDAARQCLAAAELEPSDLHMLVHVGLYREDNVVEPALAALVQEAIGMRPDYLLTRDPFTGFSFDLMNGDCGFLTAVQLAQAFLVPGGPRNMLVVAADGHPGGRPHPAFPYAEAGGAALLTLSDSGRGFGRVTLDSDRAHPVQRRGYLDLDTMGTEGRRTVTIEQDLDVPALTTRAVDAAAARLREDGADPERTLLVTSLPTPGFGIGIAEGLGLPATAAVTLDGVDADPRTSALTLAYHHAAGTGRLGAYDTVLFVAADAGSTIATALYTL
ncbi:hypothetical protein GCM10010425_14620 [Streptomyces spororaveus]|uniref:3-oxoacyl-[acyl-carrier-protein] synthase-3 n=1 Tax=Streptomyces spororaveus TaxID=284039 RepID=A0ABQ3T5E2_9ACTN|nr:MULTISPECIES: hypothetical protein [Streptomyces]MCM9076589.1 hypothetical protein [Streptomyces spororaveus]MCX5308753.1 hypothetical protein [Streptomyces sp. NBC_00160]GHI75613.1 hypothetical protein Sspor_11740 [Streptomyces spororaveus]